MSLSVAIFNPLHGNLYHWAFHLTSPSNQHTIIQVSQDSIGSAIYYDHKNERPEADEKFRYEVEICEVGADNYDEILEVLKGTGIEEDVAHWSCQDFVMEGLEALEEKSAVEWVVVEGAKTRLMGIYNEGLSDTDSEEGDDVGERKAPVSKEEVTDSDDEESGERH